MGLFSSIGKIAGGLIGGKAGAKIGGAIGGGVDALKGAKKDRGTAAQAAQQATPVGYSTFGPLGSVRVDQNTKQATITQADNPWARVLQGLGMSQFANAATAPGSAYYGARPEIVAAAQGFSPEAMAGNFNSELQRLRAIGAPEERRQFQGLENALFARGQMGTTGGGERYRAFYEAQNAADLQRQGQAQDFARQRSLDRFNTALQAVGEGRSGAMDQYNQAQGSFGGFQSIMAQLLNQGQLGAGLASGTPGNVAVWNAETQMANSPGRVLEASGVFDTLGSLFAGKQSSGGAWGGNAAPLTGWGGPVNIPSPGPLDLTPKGGWGL